MKTALLFLFASSLLGAGGLTTGYALHGVLKPHAQLLVTACKMVRR